MAEDQASRISLFALDPVELTIAKDSRASGLAPDELPLAGEWTYAKKTPAGMHKWTTPIPIRPRGLFFHSAEPGIFLKKGPDGEPLNYSRFGSSPEEYWSHNRKTLILYRPTKGERPAPGEYVFGYPKATERERAMNLSMVEPGTHEVDFFRTSIHHYSWNTRKGLLLPAPARAVWEVTMPAAAELLMAPGISEPELLDGVPSDGATLVLSIEQEGRSTEVRRIELVPGEFEQQKVDLSQWSGQSVRLVMTVEPGATPDFDYAFIGDPVLSSRKRDSKRVVMVFIDTLRADHLGMYGYERETSTKLDAWAKGAAVFENTRSVAPWTLPSGRAIVTGRNPEHYGSTETVQKVLSDKGFASAMIAGNVYLSSNFDMARDWGWHNVGMWPRAETITNDALAWLDATEGHDAILQVHYMDAHLPYLEPKAYRKLFAGEPKGELGEDFDMWDVKKARTSDPEVRQYVIDRYDNNIRYATDEVVRLLSHLDDNDVVLIYADHGEEFWDHGGFEHGHQLHDELLHVPLVVKAPGVKGIRVGEPTSLLDITPTILDALGIKEPQGTREGVSLMPAARGESVEQLSGRELAFGRPLYGVQRWGVLTVDNQKWLTHDGQQEVFDLDEDPGERTNLMRGRNAVDPAPFHKVLGEQLDTDAGPAYRLVGAGVRGAQPHDLVVEVVVPGGARAWTEDDPVGKRYAEMPVVSAVAEDGSQTVTATWKRDSYGLGTVWIVPNLPFEDVTHNLQIMARSGQQAEPLVIPQGRPAGMAGNQAFLASTVVGGRNLRFGFGVAPIPREDWLALDASDGEVDAALKALGYREEEMGGAQQAPVPAPE